MECSEIQKTIQNSLVALYKQYSLVKIIVDVLPLKCSPYLVGGAVRDIMLKRPVGDLDIEVFGLTIDELQQILARFGNVRLVGKQYGVLRIDHLNVDFSVPRVDAKGRKPEVFFDPSLSLEQACRRRDLTMNAMAIDLKTGQFHDPFNGMKALKDRRLSVPDPVFFVEDPLRFYRVLQFMGRFVLEPDEQLSQLCRTMDLRGVSHERIVTEYEKLFLHGQKPSLAIRWLLKIGRLAELLPELAVTKECNQNPMFHPEGDVFEHTMQAVDGAAKLCYENEEKRLIIVLAALCHDLGKVLTTHCVKGVLRSYGHAEAGVVLAEQVLDRILVKKMLKRPIVRLVRYHMDPISLVKNNAGPGAYKRLALKLAPELTITDLYKLCYCDTSARNPQSQEPLKECPEPLLDLFLKKAEYYGVAHGPEKPVLSGEDLLPEVSMGPRVGALLQRAYTIQIEEGIKDKYKLKKRVINT